jgi:hypothetical protein
MYDTPTAPNQSWRRMERYAYVARSYEDVWEWLAGHLSTLGAPLPGGGHSVELRIHPVGMEVSRLVRIHVGGFVVEEDRARAALSWVDANLPHLFPQLEATLEVAPVPNARRPFTQLGVLARYRPPFGVLGALGDRLVGAEITDAALTTFVDELAAAVAEHTAAPFTDPAPAGSADRSTAIRRIMLPVDGLAVRRGGAIEIWQALEAVPGVVHVDLDPCAGLATVDHDPEVCEEAALRAALEGDAGSANLEDTLHAGGAVTG